MIATPRTSRRHYAIQRVMAVVLSLSTVTVIAMLAITYYRLTH